MRVTDVEIKNFRHFANFQLGLDGASAYVVAPNGGGKTSLLEAVAKGCGLSRSVTREDFGDLETPIEITLRIEEIPTDSIGLFSDHLQFGSGGSFLHVGLRATWNDFEQELEVAHGYPDRGWSPSTRAQREALPVLWLPADRDPTRSLQIVGRARILADLVAVLDLESELDVAVATLTEAAENLATAQPLADLLQQADSELNGMLRHGPSAVFSLIPSASSNQDVLRQLELLLGDDGEGPGIRISHQSSGLAQLALFAFAIQILDKEDASPLLLVDEPELSLHPQVQRALAARLRRVTGQALLTTHSSSILDRTDPRLVVRLGPGPDGVKAANTGPIDQRDAERLMRISNPGTAEAFFADRVILVEGESDHAAVRALADRFDRDLDAEGVSLISLEGAGSFATFLSLLGPNGLDLELSGLCDADHELSWRGALDAAGLQVGDAEAMAEAGFFVCHKDLEDEFFSALGADGVEAALQDSDQGAAFDGFAAQPNQGGTQEEKLRRFLKKRKVLCAPILVDALDLKSNLPLPLKGLFDHA